MALSTVEYLYVASAPAARKGPPWTSQSLSKPGHRELTHSRAALDWGATGARLGLDWGCDNQRPPVRAIRRSAR